MDISAGLRQEASYTLSRAFVIVVYVVAGRASRWTHRENAELDRDSE